MLKSILIGLVALILIAIVGIFLLNRYLDADEHTILSFIKNNPSKSAITLQRNGDVLVNKNGNRMMPLASAVKTVIAIEYAHQAADSTLDAEGFVSIDEFDVYYVKGSDGGAHEAWLGSIEGQIVDNKITIREVAKGMIAYSSNANTEWLTYKLGIVNVNKRLELLDIEQEHDKIYGIVSSLFVGKELFPNSKGTELKEKLLALSSEEYQNAIGKIHLILQADPKYKLDEGDNSLKIQKVWSDRLPNSTTKAYIKIMRLLNSKSDFPEKVYTYLDELMEGVMKNEQNRKWLKHSGMKGGSTASVLTDALYATDLEGNTTELAYFFTDLSIPQSLRLGSGMNAFNKKILQDEKFRRLVEEAL